MGLAGVRNPDNMGMFEAKKPLVVAYYNVDYTHNPKGSNYWRNRCTRYAQSCVCASVETEWKVCLACGWLLCG